MVIHVFGPDPDDGLIAILSEVACHRAGGLITLRPDASMEPPREPYVAISDPDGSTLKAIRARFEPLRIAGLLRYRPDAEMTAWLGTLPPLQW